MNIAIINTTGDSYSRIIFILCNDTFKCATGNINLNFSCIGSTVVLRISFINSSSTGKRSTVNGYINGLLRSVLRNCKRSIRNSCAIAICNCCNIAIATGNITVIQYQFSCTNLNTSYIPCHRTSIDGRFRVTRKVHTSASASQGCICNGNLCICNNAIDINRRSGSAACVVYAL